MTARTSELLAVELDKLNLPSLARRARDDEFHDFLSPHAMPETYLIQLLLETAQMVPDRRRESLVLRLRERVMNGDFDADKAESDEWAASPEGQAAFRELMGGKHGND